MRKYKGRIWLSITDTTSYAITNRTNLYYDQLRAAYKDIKNGKETPYLLFAFVSLCSATLEYSLNFLILEHCVDKYGPHNYKRYWEAYIKMQFKDKLYIIPTILSEGKLIINTDSTSVKKLEELITLRNRILHNKESLEEIETPDLTAKIEDSHALIPEENAIIEIAFSLVDNPIEKLTAKLCVEFGDALGDFKRNIMTPALDHTLRSCSMLKDRSW